MAELLTVSATCLNQFALDFEGNYHRILESIDIAKGQGSRFRCGPELEITGYNCEDHFHESDTLLHSWEVLAKLLSHPTCQGILVDIGMPVMRNGVTYNCRLIFLNQKILFIRPKLYLCDDGNYRESRWFTAWTKRHQVESFSLPSFISSLTGQKTVPFGDALLELDDLKIGFEICEELWSPQSTHIDQSLAGADIIVNGSGSHAEIRKAANALNLTKSATAKCGGLYVFNNLRGCDGQRVYLNGSSSIVLNGKTLCLGQQYSLLDVEVLTANVDLNEIRNYKTTIRSRSLQGDAAKAYPTIPVAWSLMSQGKNMTFPLAVEYFCCPEEEIARGPALWLWDYLRRSPASGFFLSLSGGVDSASVAIIVFSLCNLIVDYVKDNSLRSDNVLADVRRVLKQSDYVPTSPQDLCSRILTTCYMGSENSSEETRGRALNLATGIGSNHLTVDISSVVSAVTTEVSNVLNGKKPTFAGSQTENLALQNIQARSRMVYAYMLAQLTPWSIGKAGFLLVLGSSNVDEALRGYFTKYDCSAADLNPIGAISKTDLKSFILYAGKKFDLIEVAEIVEAPPTAELTPLETNQTDEKEMGMTYAELSDFGKLRLPAGCGPFSMVSRLLHLWKDRHSPSEISRKVKHFYVSYASNRHKMSILTPACHMESYSPDDHRYDLRPMFYPLGFTWQFRNIDKLIENVESTIPPNESEVD